MVRITLIIFLSIITQAITAQEGNCQRTATFGDVGICLPLITGYTEGYLDEFVKPMADATESPMNSVLGFYLNNETYNSRAALGTFAFDDYFKVYGTNELQNVPIDGTMLNDMADLMNSNFIARNWSELKDAAGPIASMIDIGTPVVIENYNLNDKSFTSIMLVKYQTDEDHSFLMTMSINGIQMQDRVIWMAYYLEYFDDNTVTQLKLANNKILTRLQESN